MKCKVSLCACVLAIDQMLHLDYPCSGKQARIAVSTTVFSRTNSSPRASRGLLESVGVCQSCAVPVYDVQKRRYPVHLRESYSVETQ